MKCKTHPDAPHGFDRNGSHSEDRYVCMCEHWEPPKPKAIALADELYRHGTLNNPNDAADELRLLHEENATLVRQNGQWQAKVEADEALLRQALEALETTCIRWPNVEEAITALRERLNLTGET